jgi:hydrogenase nickel incorporation protein HypA/HybF
MHEVALANGIVELITDRAKLDGFTTVKVVHVVVGAMSSVMPEALLFGFDAASRGTVAEGARLQIHEVLGEGCCIDCGKKFETKTRVTICPSCGGPKVLISGGEDLRVSELEVD